MKRLSDEAKRDLYQKWLAAKCFTDEATKNLIEDTAREAEDRILEQMIPQIEWLFQFASNGDYSNGNEAFGADEGRVRAGEALERFEKELRELKQSLKEEE